MTTALRTPHVPGAMDISRTAADLQAKPQDGLPVPRRYWSAIAIWLAIAMSVLGTAVPNIALPTIATELETTAANAVWVVNAYQLTVVATLFPFAALGERVGYRRVYLGGLAVFTAGSLACALSPTLATLVPARALQGLGAGAIMSINAALVRHTYPRAVLGRGVGLNALVVGVSAAAGPTVAAGVLSVADWPWLFAVSIPFGFLAIVIGRRALPSTPGSSRPFDALSALLNAAAFGFLIVGVETLARDGAGSGFAMLAVGAVAGAALVRRELGRPAPLLPLDLLRSPLFSLSVATSFATFCAQMMAFVALPFYFQGPLGRGVVETGLLMTPWPLAAALASPLAGRLSDRYPAGLLGGGGLALFAAGLATLATMNPDTPAWAVVLYMAICGAGFGFFQSPNNRTIVLSAPIQRSGAAGGMLASARLLGQTAGATVTAVLFHVAGEQSAAAAPAIAAGVAACAALISLSRLRVPDAAALSPHEDRRSGDK